MRNRPKVGEILLRAGLVDDFQLKAALGEQKRWGSRLGATLVKLGFVDERDLVRALASQLNLPVATLDGKRIHPDVLALVPVAVAEKHMVIPLFVKREGGVSLLYLGTDDPGNLEVFDDLAFRTGLEVRPVMVAPSEICEGIDRYYHRPLREGTAGPAQSSEPETPPLAPPRELDLDAESTAPVLPAPRGSRRAVTAGTEALVRHWAIAGEPEEETLPDHAAPATEAPVTAPAAVATPPAPAPVAAPAFVAGPSTPPAEPQASAVPEPSHAAAQASFSAGETAPNAFDAKTRVLLQALAQLLVEKGVMTREEFHQRVRDIQLLAED